MASQEKGWRQTYFNRIAAPFWAVHLAAIIGVVILGWSWTGLAFAVGLYFVRMFFITAGYHRYFSHRSFKTSRVGQFLLAFAAESAAQKGVLWWAALHRRHHRYSDTPQDLHSPVQGGFWWSHLGWILDHRFNTTDDDQVRDLARYPEIRWLQRWNMLPPVALAVALFAVGGAWALVWGFFVCTVMTWHGSFTINSLAHVFGKRRYDTGDDSRNHWLLAVITCGEGWHNNHHHYQRSAAQGFRWYEIDLTYMVLRLLAVFHIVWDVRRPPRHVIDGTGRARRAAIAARAPAAAAALKPAA